MTEDDPTSEAGKAGSGEKPSLFDRLRALFGLGGLSIRDDIADALADTSIEDDLSPQERALLKNVLALHEVQVGDVMVPRADIVAASLQTQLADVLEVFRTAGHSRLPVHGETLDDPRGMVHIRDFVAYIAPALLAAPGRPQPPRLSTRHGAYPRFCRLSRRCAPPASDGERRRFAAHGAGGRSCRKLPLATPRLGYVFIAGQYSPPGSVRSRVHAGPRSTGKDASHENPYGARHRRIWRHRRSSVD